MDNQEELLKYCKCHSTNYAVKYWDVLEINSLLENVHLQVANLFYPLPAVTKDELLLWVLVEAEQCCWLLQHWPKLQNKAQQEKWSPGKMHSVLLFYEAKKMKERVISFARMILDVSIWEHIKDWLCSWTYWVPYTCKKRQWFEEQYDRFNTDRVLHQCKEWYYWHYKPAVETPQ